VLIDSGVKVMRAEKVLAKHLEGILVHFDVVFLQMQPKKILH